MKAWEVWGGGGKRWGRVHTAVEERADEREREARGARVGEDAEGAERAVCAHAEERRGGHGARRLAPLCCVRAGG